MSYCFDTALKAWGQLHDRLPREVQNGELAMRFEFLLNEMHEANHRAGDVINKDGRVTACTRALDSTMAKNEV